MKFRNLAAASPVLFALATCAAQSGSAPAPHDPWASVPDYRSVANPLSCSVVKLDKDNNMPVLHLICPARQIFAPLRVYMQLSWNELKEMPQQFDDGPLPQIVKLRSNHSEVDVQMNVDENGTRRQRWVAFTNLVGLGLVQEKP